MNRFFATVRLCGVLAMTLALGGYSQPPQAHDETVYRISPATWFEDGFSSYDVCPDGQHALFRSWFYGLRFIDLTQGQEDAGRAEGGLDQVRTAIFDHAGTVVRQGRKGDQTGWFAETPKGVRLLPLPPGGLPRWSPNGSVVAYEEIMGPHLRIGTLEDMRSIELTGSLTGIGWTPKGEMLYALLSTVDGTSSLIRVLQDGTIEAIRGGFDGPHALDRLAVSPDGRTLYLTLVSNAAPDNEARHRPDADRDTDIYALDLSTGRLQPVVNDPGDDFYPVLAGNYLYWTHNEMREQIIVIPIGGGDARVVMDDGQIPYWSYDGRQLAFTRGGWRIADYALNLDAAIVDMDTKAQPHGAYKTMIAGYHEDFTPVWSPNGKWIAYHSHRSATPVVSYDAEGSTDDVYLRRAIPGAEEIRLTDFGWEVGSPDWAPDSHRLVFDSQDRKGAPGVFKVWIVYIDPATGHPQRVESLPTPEGPPGSRILSWSPTTDEIALTYPVGGKRYALAVVSLSGKPTEKLIEFEASTQGGLDWTPDGRRIVFSALAEGRMQIFIIDRRGGKPVQVTRDSNSLILPQVSPNGQWIAATRLLRAKELRRLRLP